MNDLSMVRPTNAGAGAGVRCPLLWTDALRGLVRAGTPVGEGK